MSRRDRQRNEMAGRLQATVGLLVGGFAVAVGVVAATTAILTPTAAAAIATSGVLAALGFSARRHGLLPPASAGIVAGIGGVFLLGTGAAILVDPPSDGLWFGAAGVGSGSAIVVLGIVDARGTDPTRLASGVRALSMAVLLMLGGFLVAGALLAIPEILGLDLSAVAGSAFEQVALGLGFVLATLGFLSFSGRPLDYLDLRVPDRGEIAWATGGIALVVVAALGLGLLYSWLGIEGAEHALSRRARQEGAAILLVAMPLTLVVTAVGEEVLYRNGIQKYLTERFAPAVAILLTSVLFAVAHLSALVAAGSSGILATLSVIFALSLIIGAIYERTRNVLVPIAIHGSYNVVVFGLWYLELAA